MYKQRGRHQMDYTLNDIRYNRSVIRHPVVFVNLQHAIRHIKREFPHIAERISLLWMSKELEDYFNTLVINDRPNREGFSPDVMAAINFASDEHRKVFVNHIDHKPSIWDFKPK